MVVEYVLAVGNGAVQEITHFGAVAVDTVARRLTVRGQTIETTAHEFDLLRFFVNHEDTVVSRLQILNGVWGIGQSVSERTVDNFIARLRQKIEPDPVSPCHIQTVRGVGYRFISRVQRESY